MTDNLPAPSVRPSKSSRGDLQWTILGSGLAFIVFLAPVLAATITHLSQGTSVVSIVSDANGEDPGPLVSGVERADVAVALADLPAFVATLLILADVLVPLLWTAVLALTATASMMALRGRLFSRAFDVLLGWLVAVAAVAALAPGALRHMGTNGVLAQRGWSGAEPSAFTNIWIPIILVTTLTLVIVIHRSGRSLAEEHAGTV
ncbi:hypothetical protein GCM10011490_08440 [Pseudoclavibacter endophyticus]|uniref:DUF2975 domain-containing protein n=1 Tax=Pseudoclavibacter endophyticus TaxID=1778590 RepID=A0A6H9WLH3_9MICO|nr:hypothetical protein [Pseudoclavibacter endophyticus]KAB1649686.1 hypothetical protein F8O04_05465 [Pseudoclavibacter endophyticus]GGA60581.1 hypothetical protein GCM10011490_08440 [Pseudoclavibacter endophyticus]